MISRREVKIQFIVEERFIFSATCIATVKVDSDELEIIDEGYLKDIEDLDQIEFVEVTSGKYNEEDIPSEEDIQEDDIEEIISISLD
ncbi:MAG: hypothetical protein ACRC28_06035 [Clostridium sp.]|uniref:hypothetical protein n=1 Tax=Clostridium sp. TaxID=1506 RepID=UPI003F3E3FB6